jgi:hypothetical protein
MNSADRRSGSGTPPDPSVAADGVHDRPTRSSIDAHALSTRERAARSDRGARDLDDQRVLERALCRPRGGAVSLWRAATGILGLTSAPPDPRASAPFRRSCFRRSRARPRRRARGRSTSSFRRSSTNELWQRSSPPIARGRTPPERPGSSSACCVPAIVTVRGYIVVGAAAVPPAKHVNRARAPRDIPALSGRELRPRRSPAHGAWSTPPAPRSSPAVPASSSIGAHASSEALRSGHRRRSAHEARRAGDELERTLRARPSRRVGRGQLTRPVARAMIPSVRRPRSAREAGRAR